MPPFSLRCIRMQLSRWMDGNSFEVKDGWVSVEVNRHLSDQAGGRKYYEKTERVLQLRGDFLECNFTKLPIETDVTHGEQNSRR